VVYLVNWFSIIKVGGINTQYLLKDNIWEESGATGQPTIEELEKLLGRKLVKDDFKLNWPITWDGALEQPQVLERIGREGIIQGIDEYVKNPMEIHGGKGHYWLDLPKAFEKNKIKIKEILNKLGINPKRYLDEFDKNAINLNKNFDYAKLVAEWKAKEEE
jgi:hypothetical protein